MNGNKQWRESNMGDCAQFVWMYDYEWWNVICSLSVFHWAIALAYNIFIYIFFAASYASMFVSFWHCDWINASVLVSHIRSTGKRKVIVSIDSALHKASQRNVTMSIERDDFMGDGVVKRFFWFRSVNHFSSWVNTRKYFNIMSKLYDLFWWLTSIKFIILDI